MDGLNHQPSVLLASVASAGGVVLEFIISPTIAAGFRCPLLGIDWRAVGTVELIAPRQHPFWFLL
jgi:hypothetical protein